MSETKAWEVDTCRGHFNNISSVLFHPRHELIVSVAEDKTIRVWDMGKRTAIQTFRREHDRFWVLTAHPNLNLFAAGHDNGLIVFKLERERPAFSIHQNILYYVRDKQVRQLDFQSGNDMAVLGVKKLGSQYTQPRALSFNPAERSVIVTTLSGETGTYDLAPLPRDVTKGDVADSSTVGKRGQATSALFVARNRLAVLQKASQTIEIRDLTNTVTKTIPCPTTSAINDIFFGGTGSILLSTATGMILFDIQQQAILSEITCPPVKYVVWSADGSLVALLSKHTITLSNKALSTNNLVHETIRIKSAAWDDSGVLIYSTLNHIKYALPQGDSGIIKTLEAPVYLTRVRGKTVNILDRSARPQSIAIDPTEFRFKLALTRGDYDEVLRIIKTSNLVGQAIIAYLQKKGFPEIALHFVQDKSTRFDLAIECGNLDVALETAEAINVGEVWQRLGDAALKQGNHKIVERAYQKTKSFDKLSFLYLITGNKEKLAKMSIIAEKRGDAMSRFQNSLFLGDVSQRIVVLQEAGMDALAYATAKSNGQLDLAASIAEEASMSSGLTGVDMANSVHGEEANLGPPPCITEGYLHNWPIVGAQESYFDKALVDQAEEGGTIFKDNAINGTGPDTNQWLDGDDFVDAEDGDEDGIPGGLLQPVPVGGAIMANAEAEEAWDLDDDELVNGVDEDVAAPLPETALPDESSLDPGVAESDYWIRNSPIAADHAAAGSFISAMNILTRQGGIVDFTPLKPLFLESYLAAKAYLPAMASLPSIQIPLRRNVDETARGKVLPAQPRNIRSLGAQDLQEAYRAVNANKLEDAEKLFRIILYKLVMTVGNDETQGQEIIDMMQLCREYLLGIAIELHRRRVVIEEPDNVARQLELAALFTHAQMQVPHQQLALRAAMNAAQKAGNTKMAGGFARRLLDLNPAARVAQLAQQILAMSDRNPRDAIPIPTYDAHERSFIICAASHVLIPAGGIGSVEDPLTGAKYLAEYKGTVCRISQISIVGKVASGLRTWL
jgi:coatomer protein complex subunit alpha (xenin)